MNKFLGKAGYREVEHTADIAIAVTGDSLSSLFTQATRAMAEIARVEVLKKIEGIFQNSIEATYVESLLVAFLNELVFLLESNHWPIIKRIEICQHHLTYSYHLCHCTVKGHEIKAVTYNLVEIIEHAGLYSTMIVFDV